MAKDVKVEELNLIGDNLAELSELLAEVVEDGAAIGFLPLFEMQVAENYWESLLNPDVILFIAKINNDIAGSIQLHLPTKQNGSHRGEIAKVMTHPDHRRNGIGRLMMKTVEERAKQEGLSLLILDTREGDVSNQLYRSMGYVEAGRIPDYAKSADGQLHATIFYYKFLK